MPSISHFELAKLGKKYEGLSGMLEKTKAIAAAKTKVVKETGEALAGAAAFGGLRGYLEKSGKSLELPYIGLDAELVAGLGLAGCAMFDLFGEYNDDAQAVATGILSHYVGQVARNSAKTGKFVHVGGDCIGGDCGSPIAGALSGL
jgi:hypothetical protein